MTNVKGEVRVQGVSGNLALEGTSRLAAVKTVSGGITITNGGADAQLSLSTVNGDLLVQTLTTRALDVNTINGDVRISGWSGDRAHIRTLDGDLDLQTSLVKGGRYEIESHSGDINLSLPEQPGFELEAHTFNGRIRVDFPDQERRTDSRQRPRPALGARHLRRRQLEPAPADLRRQSDRHTEIGSLMRRRLCFLTLLVSAFGIARVAHAQDSAQGKELRAFRIAGESPKLDGLIDEEIWLGAASIDDFTQQEPDNMAAPRERTVVQVAYDDRYLYVAVRCFTADPATDQRGARTPRQHPRERQNHDRARSAP